MEDNQIIKLYFERSEQAIQETDTKYGGYCYSIAYNILTNQEDAEESVSDTYLSAWNSMPPRRPPALASFLGKITRNISIDRWRKYRAFKRGEGQIEIALDELSECVSGAESAEETAIRKEILASLLRGWSMRAIMQQMVWNRKSLPKHLSRDLQFTMMLTAIRW